MFRWIAGFQHARGGVSLKSGVAPPGDVRSRGFIRNLKKDERESWMLDDEIAKLPVEAQRTLELLVHN